MSNAEVIQTDDRVLRVKNVWKGTDSFTIPFDARYGAWAAGFVMSIGGVMTSWAFTKNFASGGPAGGIVMTLLIAVAVTAAAFWVKPHLPGRRWLLLFGLLPWLLATFTPMAVAGGPAGSLLALATAVGVGVGGPVLVIRKVGRLVTKTTPLRHLVSVVQADAAAPRMAPPITRVASGPAVVEHVGLMAYQASDPYEVPIRADVAVWSPRVPVVVTDPPAEARAATSPRPVNN